MVKGKKTNGSASRNRAHDSKPLTAQERKFAYLIATGHKDVTAYKQAGFLWHDGEGRPHKYLAQHVYTLKHGKKIQREIARVLTEEAQGRCQAEEGIEFTRAKHVRLMLAAESVGDYPSATRNLEGLSKTWGAYGADEPTPEAQRRYTEAERAEADRLADLLLDVAGAKERLLPEDRLAPSDQPTESQPPDADATEVAIESRTGDSLTTGSEEESVDHTTACDGVGGEDGERAAEQGGAAVDVEELAGEQEKVETETPMTPNPPGASGLGTPSGK